MLVRRIGLVLLLTFSIAACSDKSLDQVFQQGKTDSNKPATDPDACNGAGLIRNRFIVTWENGKTTVEHSENAELFKKKFLKPRLYDIKHVEFDQDIVLKDYQEATSVEASGTNQYWGQNIAELQAVWEQGIYGQGVKVGVVDAAVDYSHVQIAPRLAKNLVEVSGKKGLDDDENGFVDDLYGWDFYQDIPDPKNLVSYQNSHGTHVSGVILADHSTGLMKGLAPQANLVPANFMSANGGGSLGAGIAAVKYVASRGVKVINASWGGPSCSQSLKNTINALANQNILFVVAAGNEGLDLDMSPDYPANYNLANQITVGASNIGDYLTTWSNSSFNFVHIGAPGENIYSTVAGGYGYMSGTSMAAPFVTGAAALLWSVKPTATFVQIRQALLNSVDLRNLRVSSKGRMNVRKAVEEIRRIVP